MLCELSPEQVLEAVAAGDLVLPPGDFDRIWRELFEPVPELKEARAALTRPPPFDGPEFETRFP